MIEHGERGNVEHGDQSALRNNISCALCDYFVCCEQLTYFGIIRALGS